MTIMTENKTYKLSKTELTKQDITICDCDSCNDADDGFLVFELDRQEGFGKLAISEKCDRPKIENKLYVPIWMIRQNVDPKYKIYDNMGNSLVTNDEQELLEFVTFDDVIHPGGSPGVSCGLNGTSCPHGVGNAYKVFPNKEAQELIEMSQEIHLNHNESENYCKSTVGESVNDYDMITQGRLSR